jgi:phospholipid transport system substrate-binding protein
MNRRALLLLTAAFAAPALAQDLSARAAAFIQQAGNELVGVINGPGSAAQKRDRIAAILRRTVDIEGVGRFVLGRYVRTATPQELAEYMRLFEQTLVRNLTSRLGEFQGLTFTVGRNQQRTEEDALVATVISRPNQPPANVDWRVSEVGGGLRVVDVVAENTSLRLTQRSEYAAVIQRGQGRVAALLDAMRAQLAQLEAREQAQR